MEKKVRILDLSFLNECILVIPYFFLLLFYIFFSVVRLFTIVFCSVCLQYFFEGHLLDLFLRAVPNTYMRGERTALWWADKLLQLDGQQ